MKVSNSQCHLSHVLVLGSLGIFGEVLGRFWGGFKTQLIWDIWGGFEKHIEFVG
jgi:hypothetical protein